MNYRKFNEIFISSSPRGDNKIWNCQDIHLLRRNFIFSDKYTSFNFSCQYEDLPEQGNFTLEDANNNFIDTVAIIPFELYSLNAPLKKIHPSYQILLDEMIEKEKPTFLFELTFNEEIVISIDVDNSSYWLAGDSFKYTFNLWDFKFLNTEEKKENADV